MLQAELASSRPLINKSLVSRLRSCAGNLKKHSGLLLLALPGIIALFIFNYLPLYGLVLPFKAYRFDLGFWGSPWIGFENFKFLFTGNVMLRVLRNTLGYNFIFIFLGTFLSVSFAILLFELGRRSVRVYQTVLFFPYFISWVVASYALLSIFDMEYGILNRAREAFGLEGILWYNEPRYWPVILVLVAVWKGLGYGIVIYYAALMGVDTEIYEAARIDGAGKLQQIRSISIPMIQPIIIMMLILQIGKIFYSDFGLFYNVPLNSPLLSQVTEVIDTYVYKSLIELGDIGMAAAAGFFQATIGFLLVLATNFTVRRINADNALF